MHKYKPTEGKVHKYFNGNDIIYYIIPKKRHSLGHPQSYALGIAPFRDIASLFIIGAEETFLKFYNDEYDNFTETNIDIVYVMKKLHEKLEDE